VTAYNHKILAGLLVWLFLLTGCRGPATTHTRLIVFAASSLVDVFGEMERDFEAHNPGVDVVIVTAGSQVLRYQIEQGANPDIFASANEEHINLLSKSGHVLDHQIFSHNQLVIVVPEENPAGLVNVQDLPKADRIVLGTKAVPVGDYAHRFLELAHSRLGGHFRAEVSQKVVSREANVRLVLAKVELGEADAAIVYRTDATSKRRVQVIPIPQELNPRADYHMGVLADSSKLIQAQKWLSFVVSGRGKSILQRHGFMVD
jgi:molybdate transport system substrate-binding protein